MTLNDYQAQALKTSGHVMVGASYVYPTLGLVSEAGEVAGKVKKIFRDNKGVLDPERLDDLKKELGDVLWYVADIATHLQISLDDVAQANIEKLRSRAVRDKISGSGDNR